jgi:hypothetical protein
MYLYSVDVVYRRGRKNQLKSRLVNVRLDPDRVRKAQVLRERGVSLSDVVREAIDQKYDAVEHEGAPKRLRTARDVRAFFKELYEMYPDPPDHKPLDYDVSDRHAAREAILRKLRSRHR